MMSNPLYAPAAYTEAVTAVVTATTFTDYVAARMVLQAAWNTAISLMLSTSEPCERCRGSKVIVEYGMHSPCPECCTIVMR